MQINVNITRRQSNDIITEVFTWNPHSRMFSESNRNLGWILKFVVAVRSMHSRTQAQLTDIIYNERSIIYMYKGFIQDVPSYESFKFTYNPVLGSRTCRNCRSYRNNICFMRGKKGGKAIRLKGCTDWNEPLHWRKGDSSCTT